MRAKIKLRQHCKNVMNSDVMQKISPFGIPSFHNDCRETVVLKVGNNVSHSTIL